MKNVVENIRKQINGQGESLDTLRVDLNDRDKKVNDKITNVKEGLMEEIHEARQSMGQYATNIQIENVNNRIDEMADKISKCATHEDIDKLQMSHELSMKTYDKNFQKLFTDIGELKGMLKARLNS